MAKHPVFPDVPRWFWRRFHKSWGEALRAFEQTITLATSFGDDPKTPYFDSEDAEYWHVIRSLHARTCLHARGVLALLTNGLIDPAWVQWRACHESATIALFIADDPKMAPRYLRHSLVNEHHFAQTLYGKEEDHDAFTKSDLDYLNASAESVKRQHEQDYGYLSKSRDYSWSGLQNFAQIETCVQEGWCSKTRPEYAYASERVHAAPIGAIGVTDDQENVWFPVGPMNGGLTDPADLTCRSIMHATLALMSRARPASSDLDQLLELVARCQTLGSWFWLTDPAMFCRDCGGHVPEASPPEEIPDFEKPGPCRCTDFATG